MLAERIMSGALSNLPDYILYICLGLIRKVIRVGVVTLRKQGSVAGMRTVTAHAFKLI